VRTAAAASRREGLEVTPTAPGRRPSFGIATAPSQVAYGDIVRVWREADAIPQIEHAWLYDHLMPIFGDPNGPTFEGWTLLAALAAQTRRLRLGLLVTSNRFRPPAMLAKIAAGVDVISGGRLEFGIGAGSNVTVPFARREYAAHGLPYHDAADAVGSLAEACVIIRRLWTEAEPFDFDGRYYHLAGAFCRPQPVQRPGPPVMIGGRSTPTLRVVARHADRWNMPGGGIEDAVARSAALDRLCAEIGRDPAEITRSVILPASYDQPGATRDAVAAALGGGFSHIVLSLAPPYPDGAARWLADTFITPVVG
jgi:alkanesulfonate monooxygenase SsuD/methylene tetrahydromethanopterin reductase-like flavin-dependent oxidoreductase (luciferase family)